MIDYRAPLDELPDPLPILPLEKPFDVTIRPPGSKSITNRAYVLAALAEGESKIIRPLRSEDTDALLNALCVLGAEARWEGDDVFIKGVAGRLPRGGSVNLGDGGTPTRFMIAAACLAAEPVVVDGSPRMRERPIAEGVEMLRQLGAKIEYVEEEERLPVRVVPSEDFKGGELTIGKTASSQFISAILLIAPWLESGVHIKYVSRITSASYVNVTVNTLDRFEAKLESVRGPGKLWVGFSIGRDFDHIQHVPLHGTAFPIDPDASSAAYWFLAASMIDGAKVTIAGLPWNTGQPDIEVAWALDGDCYAVDGASELEEDYQFEGRPFIRALKRDCSNAPDGAIALAVAASVARGRSTLTGLHTLRVKETDRIAALANELRKVSCTVETTDDSITITPPSRDRPPAAPGANGDVVIETYNDHRMAMSFAVLGLVRSGIAIRNPKCVAKSYPTFWQDFAKLYE